MDVVDQVSGRRFLICHTIVHDLIGSTIVTLDLVTYLRDAGADVLVYAAFIGDPAMSLFAGAGVEVVDDAGMVGRSFSDFDVVWVNSQVLPEAMVQQLGDPLPSPMPQFVFLHMSAIHYAPDEHPYIHGLEERLSSLSLFVSQATREQLLPYFDREVVTDLYPNPTPSVFAAAPHEAPPRPRSVAVVSNHADPDLMRAKELLHERGLSVVHGGRTGDVSALVTPELLAEHDIVLTIGKTVQYCLVAGRPVYVYDHFGGYGYLTPENLDHARTWNYSGRHGERRTAEQIVDEVIDGYEDAVRFHRDNRDAFIADYDIRAMVPRVLARAERHEVEPFEPAYLLMLRSAQSFGARFFHFWGHNANEVRNREGLERDLVAAHHEHQRLRVERDHAIKEAAELHGEIERIHGSWTFKVGRWFVGPTSAMARALRRVVGR